MKINIETALRAALDLITDIHVIILNPNAHIEDVRQFTNQIEDLRCDLMDLIGDDEGEQ
jgi:hypothetical protein